MITLVLSISLALCGTGVAVALSARRRARQAVAQAELAAMLALRARDDLVANMSHELRTPLNAVIGFSEIMQSEMMGPMGNPSYVEYSRIIKESGDRLLRVISDILEISAVEVTDSHLEDSVVDIPELLEAVQSLARGQAEKARIALSVAELPPLPALRGDGPRIKRVLANLVSNAITYNDVGGEAELSAELAEDGGLNLKVRDTGIGIKPQDMERVMAPFALGEDVYARRYQGQGLGLPIARRLVELHGGILSLDSTPGKGTTATVHMPPDRTVHDIREALAKIA